MSVFADVTLSFGGTDYVIPAKKVMGAIHRIEDVITISELYAASAKQNLKFSVIARAYGEALRYAGAVIEDEEVYAGMFAGEASAQNITSAVHGLLAMMIPPTAREESANAKPGNGAKPKAAAPSSRKRSR